MPTCALPRATGGAGPYSVNGLAKVALTGGMLAVLAAFAVGAENQLSTSFMGQTQDCDERRAAAACSLVIHESRVLVVTIMGMGSLLALAEQTAIRTRGEAVMRTVTSVHAQNGCENRLKHPDMPRPARIC